MRTMSRNCLALSAALVLAASVAQAQSNNSSNAADQSNTTGSSSSSNPAVNPGNTATGDKLVSSSTLQKGANSFTEGEARSRLESAGLSNVTELRKDDAGIWRGKAKHGDKSVSVGLDYKGNMSAE